MRTTAVFLFCAALRAQEFEVATLKMAPAPDGRGYSVSSRGGPGTQDPGLFTCHNWSASDLVSTAFDLARYELSAPDWMESARFDMSAKIPEGTTKEQFSRMLQNFLVERFQVDLPSGEEGSAGIQPGGDQEWAEVQGVRPTPLPEDSDQPATKPSPMKRGEDGYPILPAGRDSTMAVMYGYATQRFGDATMEHLAMHLGFQLHTPVLDATGLKGKYDFSLRWIMDRMTEDTGGPNLFRALQEQLGLKLDSTKVPINVLIVDHFEKTPTEN